MRSVQSSYPCMLLMSVVAGGLFTALGCGGQVDEWETSTGTGADELGRRSDADDDEDDSRGKPCCKDDEGDGGAFDPTAVYVEDIRAQGSGCPKGSVVATVAPDGQSFTLLYSEFIAEVGPDVRRFAVKKDCRVTLKLHVPKGFAASVTTVDSRGFVQLEEGVVASQTTSYRFPGAATAEGTSNFTGPITDSFLREDMIQNETRSRCGRSAEAVIDASLVVARSDRNASGVISMDAVDGLVRQVFNMEIKPCRCDRNGSP